MGRTGVLTPIAILEPIDIDGSTVSRASLHNVDIMGQTLHGCGWVGQKVEVYKANMIIPQIASAEEDEDIPHINKKHFMRPKVCPVCGGPTELRRDANTLNMFCANPDCEGKLINKLDHFCGKKGLDIKGLSKATLEKLIDWGWVSELIDIYKLNDYKTEWVQKPGFGEKSVANVLAAIEASKNPSLQAFISAIGIPLIGKSMSKELVKYISSYEEFRKMVNEKFDFSKFDGFAGSKTDAIWNYDYRQADAVYELVKPLSVEPTDESEKSLANYSIVITGRLTKFKNRAELQRLIEEKGGKVVGSVSNNTDFLINNDINSTSAKNMTARKLNIPIITEEDFAKRFL
jgi:DNA ligase (NAD+)